MIKLYFKFLSMHIRCQMQYKLSFLMSTLGQFLISFTVFLGIQFMFSRFNKLDGFSFPQVLLCFSTVLMAFSLAECFGRGFDLFPRMISNYELDRALVRPRNEIFLVLASQLDITRLGRLLQAILTLCYAIPSSGVVWSASKILTLFLMIICGSITFFGLFLIRAAISFFTIEGLEFMNIFTDGGREFGQYPFSAYGRGVLRFLTYVIPLALFQYYPLLYLLDMEQDILYMLTPVFSLFFIIPSLALWKIGLRRYKSVGS